MLSSFLSDPGNAVVSLIAVIVALTIHEWAHAMVAYRLGDRTAYASGRLTLNPLAHLDLWGFLSLVLIGFGWGKPVPVSTMRLHRGKWGVVAVSLAGVVSNFALAFFLLGLAKVLSFVVPALFIFHEGTLGYLLFWDVIVINLYLGLFNLIPIPPLDGSRVVMEVLALSEYRKVQWERIGPLILIAAIVLDFSSGMNLLGGVLGGAVSAIFNLFNL